MGQYMYFTKMAEFNAYEGDEITQEILIRYTTGNRGIAV
jgi:hypothetical protein